MTITPVKPRAPRRRVVVVQPYVPGYRTSFFRHLQARLDSAGVALEVLHGVVPPQQAARRDASFCPCAVQVPSLRLPAPGGRSLLWRQVFHRAASADAVVLEQALRNLEAYPLLLRQLIGRVNEHAPRVAFWGHGRTYTKKTSRLQEAAKDAVTRQADWFFAYTDGGAGYVASRGFPRDRITVLRNSVDTTDLTLTRDCADLQGSPEHAEVAALRKRYSLEPGRTALYVGGLDAPKRIAFLLQCARRIATGLPGFRLLVAGDGVDRALVEAAASAPNSPVVALGHRTGRNVGLLGAVSDVILMPGRVGLCAVDSFALRTPIVTTDWPWHAPEFEYLEDGRNAVVTRDDPEAYVVAVQKVLNDRSRLESLREACRRDAVGYTAAGMAERFCDGLLHMLEKNS
ncbi:glycosyltransferase family 4 protein [Streptomyces xiangluensis]|uniref:Glycosyltransferase family 4 protein n=1 Tax=Streptomyces xiangluensis TaxID=2665720 RepID=A0ABV8Z4A9_9ACTN